MRCRPCCRSRHLRAPEKVVKTRSQSASALSPSTGGVVGRDARRALCSMGRLPQQSWNRQGQRLSHRGVDSKHKQATGNSMHNVARAANLWLKSHGCLETSGEVGWPTGFEPATTGSTSLDSTIELRPPVAHP